MLGSRPLRFITLALILLILVVGCEGGEGSPKPTATPAVSLPLVMPTSTAVPLSDQDDPIPTPSEDQRPPKRPVFCHEFDTWRQANAAFKVFGGPENDPYGMDPDGDGIPCETLREQELGR